MNIFRSIQADINKIAEIQLKSLDFISSAMLHFVTSPYLILSPLFASPSDDEEFHCQQPGLKLALLPHFQKISDL